MAKKNGYSYFAFFREMIDCACEAATALNSMFSDYQSANLRQEADAIHRIEHDADLKKHDMMSHLLREFLPPIDREDIVNISHVLDEVVDLIEEVVICLYMNNIQKCRPDVVPMVSLIAKQCEELKKLMAEFENYKKSDKLMESIIVINTLEEEGDRLYLEAMRSLTLGCADALELVAWRDIYSSLEDCCDACEKVADAVEEVVMKNT
ncbi:MAG TPA: DUF47 family protein [Candidatus Pullichristensenella stercorigallinarum]|uniref:DUF47 family protein n=1 Tax=Candidatus Pullichristensenella stercorigallinarum TaxID=2840909 RepID=A0A9D1CVP8_9FIRM|nr:DUF47 family protein [Candidatus Pullichristensenella stercorigallinarum]